MEIDIDDIHQELIAAYNSLSSEVENYDVPSVTLFNDYISVTGVFKNDLCPSKVIVKTELADNVTYADLETFYQEIGHETHYNFEVVFENGEYFKIGKASHPCFKDDIYGLETSMTLFLHEKEFQTMFDTLGKLGLTFDPPFGVKKLDQTTDAFPDFVNTLLEYSKRDNLSATVYSGAIEKGFSINGNELSVTLRPRKYKDPINDDNISSAVRGLKSLDIDFSGEWDFKLEETPQEEE